MEEKYVWLRFWPCPCVITPLRHVRPPCVITPLLHVWPICVITPLLHVWPPCVITPLLQVWPPCVITPLLHVWPLCVITPLLHVWPRPMCHQPLLHVWPSCFITPLLHNNSSTSFCLRSSSCGTDLSIHFQPSRPATIWMFFLVTQTLSSSTFVYETDHRTCEITLGDWHSGLRLFKLRPPLHIGFEPRSLAWLACSTGQSNTPCVITQLLHVWPWYVITPLLHVWPRHMCHQPIPSCTTSMCYHTITTCMTPAHVSSTNTTCMK